MQESYLGKVKLIYIDPPYNTGKDFVYHDNFKASIDDYEEATEYKDESGNIQFKKNEKSNGRYHSDWLSMMYPRLKLARNLLSEDGVIFISIGDDEQANLKKLCDEIFGEDNMLGCVVRKSQTGTNNKARYFSPTKDYIYSYGRTICTPPFSLRVSSDESEYSLIEDEDQQYMGKRYKRGESIYKTGLRGSRPNSVFGITCPDGEVVFPPRGKHFKWSKARFESEYSPEKDLVRVIFRKVQNSNLIKEDGTQANWSIYEKSYLPESGHTQKVQSDLLTDTKFTNNSSVKALGDLDLNTYFDYMKPLELMKWLLSISHSDNKLVVDFFSGSGSTAHAVMQLNAEDGGNRKWIMVQLPEETDEKSEAFRAGYKTIPEISRERIRRAGNKIAEENPDAKVDYGFRALTITDTNYKEVYKSAGQYTQGQLLEAVDNIKEDRTDLDLLYGVLTATALELNRPLEKRSISGSDVYLYDYFGETSGLVACFSDSVPEETIKEIASLKPLTAVFKDSSFPDSQAKVNLSEHFRILSPDTKVKVI